MGGCEGTTLGKRPEDLCGCLEIYTPKAEDGGAGLQPLGSGGENIRSTKAICIDVVVQASLVSKRR